ncbi:MAG: hypothetical protein QW273_02485 [Candidatus Pacearchaeota archaeon]
MLIKKTKVKIIKNSRKEKTIEVRIKTERGVFSSSAPSGKSKGKNEVRDYNTHGIKHSVLLTKRFLEDFLNKNFYISSFEEIEKLEKLLKDFEDKYGSLGGNAWYAIEGAFLKAAAKENNQELWKFISKKDNPSIPIPIGNAIGGGLHTKSHKKPDFQEFLFIGTEKKISKAVSNNILAYYEARAFIRKKEKRLLIKRNDENAFVTSLSNQEVLEIMRDIAKIFNLKIGIDVAASTFFDGKEFYDYKNKRYLRDKEEQIEYMLNLIKEYDLFYVEDPFHEEDFLSFSNLLYSVQKLKKDTLIVGDDLTVTNLERVKKAKKLNSINAVIIKPNQVGSILEVKKVVDFCKKNKIKIVFSHRSGETMDNILADYAVGFGADFIKTGIYGRERLIKLKRLIDIEEKSNINKKEN